MVGLNRNKATISFSDIGDSDLIKILSEVDYNFAGYCKELMRDGLKYRGLVSEKKKPIIISNEQKQIPTIEKKNQPTNIDKKDLLKHVESKFDKLGI